MSCPPAIVLNFKIFDKNYPDVCSVYGAKTPQRKDNAEFNKLPNTNKIICKKIW